MSMKIQKQMVNGRKPRSISIIWAYVFGASSDTTSSEMANPKTTSLNASMRETSCARFRKGKASGMGRLYAARCQSEPGDWRKDER